MVELHLEPVGANVRLLSRRLMGRPEGTAEPKPAPPQQRKAEHGERNGNRQRAAQDEEAGGGKSSDPGRPANDDSELPRVGRGKQPPGKKEKDEERTTGEKIRHGLGRQPSCWRRRMAAPLFVSSLKSLSALRPPVA